MTSGFLSGSKNFCKLLWVSCEVFVFARICLDPLGSQILYNCSISTIVSRFTTFTENFVICCNEVTKNFLHEERLRQCVFRTGRRSEYEHCVYPNPHFSLALKDNPWEELACESLRSGTLIIHKIFSEFLQPLQLFRIQRVAPFWLAWSKGLSVLYRGIRFFLVLDFGLAWATTGLPILCLQHVNFRTCATWVSCLESVIDV